MQCKQIMMYYHTVHNRNHEDVQNSDQEPAFMTPWQYCLGRFKSKSDHAKTFQISF